MPRTLTALVAALTLLIATAATAQPTCRPDRLGNAGCLGAPPVRERPATPFRPPPGLDRPEARAPTLIPESRVNSFGDIVERPATRPGPAVWPNPRCRQDSFGNLRCP